MKTNQNYEIQIEDTLIHLNHLHEGEIFLREELQEKFLTQYSKLFSDFLDLKQYVEFLEVRIKHLEKKTAFLSSANNIPGIQSGNFFSKLNGTKKFFSFIFKRKVVVLITVPFIILIKNIIIDSN